MSDKTFCSLPKTFVPQVIHAGLSGTHSAFARICHSIADPAQYVPPENKKFYLQRKQTKDSGRRNVRSRDFDGMKITCGGRAKTTQSGVDPSRFRLPRRQAGAFVDQSLWFAGIYQT